MINAIYLHATNVQSHFLAERWLKSRDSCSNTCLLTHPAAHKTAKELKVRYNLTDLFVLPKEDDSNGLKGLNEKLRTLGLNKLISPISMESYELQFTLGTQMPELKRYYKLFRLFWLIGFREFELYSLFGTRTLRIPYLLDEFVDRHRDQRCFIVGNGPSLNKIDMAKLKDEITFGCNRCFLGYEKWGYPFTYWAFGDRLQVEQYKYEYEENIPSHTTKFFPFEYLPFLEFENICPIPFHFGVRDYPKFSDKPTDIYMGHSMVYMLMQIAAVMGFKTMILVGVDHTYNLSMKSEKSVDPLNFWGRIKQIGFKFNRKIPNTEKQKNTRTDDVKYWKASDAKDATHFDNRYTEGENKKFIPPRPKLSELAYDFAAQWAKNTNVEILNASPGTGLKSFPSVDFDKLF